MNIIIFYKYAVLARIGGIARISDTLGKVFRSNGNIVWYVAASKKHIGEFDESQVFLPDDDYDNRQNIDFLKHFLLKKRIDVILYQGASYNTKELLFLKRCACDLNVRLISCFHTSIYTNVKNYGWTQEVSLKEKHLHFLFWFLTRKPIKWLLTNIYICIHRKLFSDVLNLSDDVVVLSEGQKNELRNMCGASFDKHKNHVFVIPNCLQTQHEIQENKDKCVLWVGSMNTSVKRPDLMIKIWSRIESRNDSWKLIFLGDGKDIEYVKSEAKRLALKNVVFAGRVDPVPYYKKASLICVTSTHESFSLVTVEAMSYGVVPLVYNSFPTISEIIENKKDGFLIKAFDINAFSSQLECLMNNDALIKEIRKNAISTVSKFSVDDVYKKWNDLLNCN